MAKSRRSALQEEFNSWPAFFHTTSSLVLANDRLPGSSDSLMNGPDLRKLAMAWANGNLQLASDDAVIITRAYKDSVTGIYHCYMGKESQGLPIINSVAQLTMSNTGTLLAHSRSWVKTDGQLNLVKRSEALSCSDALKRVATNLQEPVTPGNWKQTTQGKLNLISGVKFTSDDVKCEEVLYQTANGLAHVYSLSVPTAAQYMTIMVDIASGKILGASDLTSHYSFTPNGRLKKRHVPLTKRQAPTINQPSFRALQLGALDPITVARSLIQNPVDLKASPQGWNDNSGFTTGNNVFATENSANVGSTREIAARIPTNPKSPKLNSENSFDSPAKDKTDDPTTYASASITNAFFVSNRVHDILHQYGFDEQSGNFQVLNFDKGGKGNDPVLAIVQDGSGTNNGLRFD